MQVISAISPPSSLQFIIDLHCCIRCTLCTLTRAWSLTSLPSCSWVWYFNYTNSSFILYSRLLPHILSTFQSLLKHLFLPAFTFAIAYVGEYHLIMRSSITGVMKEDYALTARAKGLSENAVLWRHVVPNAMLPTVTVVMMNLGFVMSGAILAESVFNWPGLGLLSYDSMQKRDYPVMQAVFLIASIAVIVANLIADIMYYYLDPRVQA